MHCLCHDDDEGDDNEVFADVGMAERDLESPALPWAGPINQHAIPLSLKIPGMCGAELFPAGRGEDKNPRGGAKVKIRGAGRGKRTRKSTDPKI